MSINFPFGFVKKMGFVFTDSDGDDFVYLGKGKYTLHQGTPFEETKYAEHVVVYNRTNGVFVTALDDMEESEANRLLNEHNRSTGFDLFIKHLNLPKSEIDFFFSNSKEEFPIKSKSFVPVEQDDESFYNEVHFSSNPWFKYFLERNNINITKSMTYVFHQEVGHDYGFVSVKLHSSGLPLLAKNNMISQFVISCKKTTWEEFKKGNFVDELLQYKIEY